MKGSKKFGKSIIVIAMSLVLMISALAPMAVMGSSNDSVSSQYRYYSVKSGDTLTSIAQKNGVTVSDIMTYNNLVNGDLIYKGQILKLPITAENSSSSNSIASTLTFKAVDANVSDILSAIAYSAGYTVIYKGAGIEKISVELENVSPLKAIDYVTRLVGLSYLKDGNTILVSTPSDLNSTFVDSLVLTKFTFKYITYEELVAQAGSLGLSNMKVVSQSNNMRSVWISAYPKEMAKLHELVKILDAPENISVGSTSIAAAFTPIELEYISASEFSSLLSSLGLHAGITTSSHPMTLYVYVSGQELNDIMTIKSVVDIVENQNSSLGDVVGGDSTTTVPAEQEIMKKIELVNISRADAISLIAGYDVSTYGHARMAKTLWLIGTSENIAAAEQRIASVDESVVAAADTVHTYTAQNCTVDEIMARLSNFSFENVKFYKYDHSSIENDLIVICDDVTWNNEVYNLLVKLDTVDTGAPTWITIASLTNSDKTKAEIKMNEKIDLMKELYPEVFEGVEYKVVVVEIQEAQDNGTGILTGGSYKAVAYAKVTSSQATRMTNLLKQLDNA